MLAAGLLTARAWPLLAQETITLRNGQTQQVRVLGVVPTGVKIQAGDAAMVEPYGDIARVTMAPPPEFTAVGEDYDRDDLRGALEEAGVILQKYQGLPTDWARQAMLMAGNIYLSLNQLQKAEDVYADFQRIYPGAASDELNVGLALIAIAHGNLEAARAKIEPILAQALTQWNPPKETAALIGRAWYASARIKEQSGDFPGALEDYLRAAVVFPEDRVAAADARQRADSLREAHGIAVP